MLFLKDKQSKQSISYQLFIEPKGQHLVKNDQWKEDFLKEIESQFRIDTLFETDKYRLIGMPFYNEDAKKDEFKKAFVDSGKLDKHLLEVYETMLIRAEDLLQIMKDEKSKRGKFTYKTYPQANKDPAEDSIKNAFLFFNSISKILQGK